VRGQAGAGKCPLLGREASGGCRGGGRYDPGGCFFIPLAYLVGVAMRMMFVTLIFVLLLMIVGWAQEQDRLDELRYEPVRAEIMASAPHWAVTE